MSKRNDPHSPANLVTEDYEYIFAEVNHIDGVPGWVLRLGDFGLEMSRRIHSDDTMGRGTHQCHHCGARLNYFAVLEHKPTGKLIVVGETCLDNRFERSTADFQKLRKQAELDRAKMRIKKAVAAFVDANPDLAFMADKDHEHTNGFVADVSRKLRLYGELSERQVEAVRKSIVRDAEYAARKAQEAADRAAEELSPVIEGKQQVSGEVLSTRWQDSDFGSVKKMLVKDDRGFKVWGTVPSNILDTEKGDRVVFSATITKSDDDESFGFYKRPTKAINLTEKEEA